MTPGFPENLPGPFAAGLPRVKICGITRWEDARTCLSLPVHALGFNFYPRSSRYISPQDARDIIRRLPPLIGCIGVFVNEPNPAQVEILARAVGLHAVQLHGDESPEYCRALSSLSLVKAFRLQPGFDVEAPARYPASAYLVDAFAPGEFGGTGLCCDWEAAALLARRFPVLLSGGLTEANVAAAIGRVRPLAVDVCSGVESAPGIKDPEKIRRFLRAVSAALPSC